MESDPASKYRVILVAACTNLITFGFGTCVGWTSPIVPKLSNHTEDSPLANPITTAEEGWIGSLLSIGAIVMGLIAGPIGDRIGKKLSLLLSAVLLLISYIFLLVASELWMMYVARVLQGSSGALVISNVPMYVAEISTDNLRGPLGSILTLFMVGGILFSYCIGPWASYVTLQWCCLVVPIVFFILFFFMPESPYFLTKKGRKLDVLKSLKFLRGHDGKAIEDEMYKIQVSVEEDGINKGSHFEIFTNRGYLKALIISTGLVIFAQLSGTTAVTFNSQSIFTSAHSSLDPAVATILLALTQFISNLITPFVVERMGRKIILLISAAGMAVSQIILGAFFYVQAYGDERPILWIPIPALIVFNITYAFGFGPIPWTMLGELFPSNVRGIAGSFACTSSWTTAFVITRFFPELNALGAFYAFWIFGGLCVVAFIFVLFYVIETKGLSLDKIQEKLQS